MRILLVDDEPDLRQIAQLALEAVGGHAVIATGSATEALAIAAREPIDAIVMDVMMPGLDGPATVRALAQSAITRAIPVIFVTAKQQRTEIEGYRKLGVAGVIGKPFDPMTLSSEIERLLAARHG